MPSARIICRRLIRDFITIYPEELDLCLLAVELCPREIDRAFSESNGHELNESKWPLELLINRDCDSLGLVEVETSDRLGG